jgi:hypothetical protein
VKVASFHVRATMAQSIAWKRAAEAHGHASVGTWIAESLDRYLDALKRAGKPLPLAWRRAGHFKVRLMDGREVEVPGRVAFPFGIFRGSVTGEGLKGCKRHSLVYLPQGRILATMTTEGHCKALASELSRVWVRWSGNEPSEDPAPLLQRFQREDA